VVGLIENLLEVSAEVRKSWEVRVQELEDEGLTRSDAQSAADVEANNGLIEPAL